MPSQNAHLDLARRNQELIDHFRPDLARFSDWVTTVAFYRALHLVEAVFAADPSIKHGGDHGQRLRLLKNTRRYEAIFKAYQPLWTASVIARYLEDKESATEVSSFSKYRTPEQVDATILRHYLRRVESAVEQLVGRSLQSPPTPS